MFEELQPLAELAMSQLVRRDRAGLDETRDQVEQVIIELLEHLTEAEGLRDTIDIGRAEMDSLFTPAQSSDGSGSGEGLPPLEEDPLIRGLDNDDAIVTVMRQDMDSEWQPAEIYGELLGYGRNLSNNAIRMRLNRMAGEVPPRVNKTARTKRGGYRVAPAAGRR